MNKVNYNTIIRFFKNECSEEERLLIIKWVNESQEHAEQYPAKSGPTKEEMALSWVKEQVWLYLKNWSML